MSLSTLISILLVLPLAQGIAFGGPAPTGTSFNANRAVAARKSEPTKGPSIHELRKRQFDLSFETCGWAEGDSSLPITCSLGRTCMLYAASSGPGMAGCCDGSDTQECGWANSCVDFDSFTAGSCDSDCLLNTFVRKCTDSASPYCVTMTYPGDDVADYGCLDTSLGAVSILQTLSDDSSTSVSLPTISGNAVTGTDGETTDTTESTASDSFSGSFSGSFSDLFPDTTTDSTETTEYPSSGGSSSSSSRPEAKKKVSVALIAGAVVGGLFLLFIVGAIVIFICVKKKKSKQLAANQQAIAAAQANRSQSEYPTQQQPQMQQSLAPMPPPAQTPQAYQNGYFAPPGQQDQKFNAQNQTQDLGLHSPISNPSTPAPAYVQPYYAPPPIPTQSPALTPAREPMTGAHEVDAITVPRPQAGQGPVFEMGSGK